MKKYELTDESRMISEGIVLHRIRAIRDYVVDGRKVKYGELGGFVESYDNLSHDGGAWIDENAYVYGNAKIYGDAQIFGESRISGNAIVYGNAVVSEYACVYGNASVYGNAWVHDSSAVYGNARVYGDACVCDHVNVYGDARVHGIVNLSDNAQICGDADIKKGSDYFVAKNVWSSFRWFTYTRSNKMWKVGCFYGTSDELIAKAYKDSDVSGKCYEAIVRAQEEIYKTIEDVKK